MTQAALSKLKYASQCQQTAVHTTDSDTTHIFISGAHCDVDEVQVKAHQDVMNVIGCIVKDVSSKNQHRDLKSYKVTAPSHHAKEILSRDNWPEGIRVRPFHPSLRNQPIQLKRPSCDNNYNEEQRQRHKQYGQRKCRNNTHPRDKASHGLDEIEGLTMINRTITEDAVNVTCKMTTNNGMTATSRNATDHDNSTKGRTGNSRW